MHTCMYAYMHVCIHVCIHAYMRTCMCMHTQKTGLIRISGGQWEFGNLKIRTNMDGRISIGFGFGFGFGFKSGRSITIGFGFCFG